MVKAIYIGQSYILQEGVELGWRIDQFCPQDWWINVYQAYTCIQITYAENVNTEIFRFMPHQMIAMSL